MKKRLYVYLLTGGIFTLLFFGGIIFLLRLSEKSLLNTEKNLKENFKSPDKISLLEIDKNNFSWDEYTTKVSDYWIDNTNLTYPKIYNCLESTWTLDKIKWIRKDNEDTNTSRKADFYFTFHCRRKIGNTGADTPFSLLEEDFELYTPDIKVNFDKQGNITNPIELSSIFGPIYFTNWDGYSLPKGKPLFLNIPTEYIKTNEKIKVTSKSRKVIVTTDPPTVNTYNKER